MDSQKTEMRQKLLKIWLIKHDKQPADLAAALNASISSVNGWKSNKPIPEERWKAIEAFFGESEHPANETYRAVGFSVTDAQYNSIVAAAEKENKSADIFARDAVLEKVARALNPPA
jgi:hypothetical protein